VLRREPPGGGALHDVLPSAAAALGVQGFDDSLGLGAARQVVVVLVDGLGLVPLRAALERGDSRAPALAAALPGAQAISAPFPSTTPAGLASLGTGRPVGCHGLVGASFVLPETGHVLWPLSWRDDPTPVAVQPEPTVLESAAADGVRVTSVSPRAFEHSGPGHPVALGVMEQNLASFGERVGRTEQQLRNIETMERAIRQLFDSLEQSRDESNRAAEEAATRAAEEAAGRAVARAMSLSVPQGPSPELKALEQGLQAVRDSAAAADRRNQQTLGAVQDTLAQIVAKIAQLESNPPAAAAEAAPEADALAEGAPGLLETVRPMPDEAAPAPEAPQAEAAAPQPSLAAGDDFIAAARRAAQAAASRPSAPSPQPLRQASRNPIAAPSSLPAWCCWLRPPSSPIAVSQRLLHPPCSSPGASRRR